ncbi:hypothetical protein [Clostridium ihumii]|nr:hypothetical protein [Clostridium ihumii]
MLEEILNIDISEIDLDILESTPEELKMRVACGITKGGGSCG